MMSALKCEICVDNFDTKRICPRVCVNCGRTICEKCLIDIKYRTETLKCPFCKNISNDIWPKNLAVLNLVEVDSSLNICEKHQRPAVSLCASKQCTLPVAICDLGECSNIHKERGTNSIALSLLGISPSINKEKESSLNVVQYFYGAVEKELLKLIKDRRTNSKVFNHYNECLSNNLKPETKKIINKVLNMQLKQTSSVEIALMKEDILDQEPDECTDLASKNQEVIRAEKADLIAAISQIVNNLKVDYLPMQHYEEPQKMTNAKLSPTFELVERVVGVKFNPYLIFDSTVHSSLVFRSRIIGQPHIVLQVELEDGTTIGAYFKRPFSKYYHEDRKMVDFDSFVFWLNQAKVYKASPNAVSNYDIGPEYYVSIGNTSNWDGFWFKDSFKEINSNSPKNMIKSSQFQKLEIPLSTKVVRVFRTYQLDMQ